MSCNRNAKSVFFRYFTGIDAKSSAWLLTLTASFFIAWSASVSLAAEGSPTAAPVKTPATQPALPAVEVTGNAGEYDLGYIAPGSVHSAVFKLVNTSDKPINIKKVRSECGCMKVIDPPEAIAAGGSVEIKVEVAAPGKSLRYSKRIVIQTDSAERSVIALTIIADIGLPLKVAPEVLTIDSSGGLTENSSVTIHNRSTESYQPLYAVSSIGGLTAQVPRAVIAPGKKLLIPIAVRDDAKLTSGQSGTITIHTNCPAQQRLTVQIKITKPESSPKTGH